MRTLIYFTFGLTLFACSNGKYIGSGKLKMVRAESRVEQFFVKGFVEKVDEHQLEDSLLHVAKKTVFDERESDANRHLVEGLINEEEGKLHNEPNSRIFAQRSPEKSRLWRQVKTQVDFDTMKGFHGTQWMKAQQAFDQGGGIMDILLGLAGVIAVVLIIIGLINYPEITVLILCLALVASLIYVFATGGTISF